MNRSKSMTIFELKQKKYELFNKIDEIDEQINSIIVNELKNKKSLKGIKWTKITKDDVGERSLQLFECWARIDDVEHLFKLFPYDYHKHYDVKLGNNVLTFNYYDSEFYIQFKLSALKDLIEMGFDITYIKDLILKEISNEEKLIQEFTKDHNDKINSLKFLIKDTKHNIIQYVD